MGIQRGEVADVPNSIRGSVVPTCYCEPDMMQGIGPITVLHNYPLSASEKFPGRIYCKARPQIRKIHASFTCEEGLLPKHCWDPTISAMRQTSCACGLHPVSPVQRRVYTSKSMLYKFLLKSLSMSSEPQKDLDTLFQV